MTVRADHVSTGLVMIMMLVFIVIVFSSLKANCVTNVSKINIYDVDTLQ